MANECVRGVCVYFEGQEVLPHGLTLMSSAHGSKGLLWSNLFVPQ